MVVKEEETYDAGVFERVKAEAVKLLKEPPSLVEPPQDRQYHPQDHQCETEYGQSFFKLLSSLLLGAASPDGMTNFISIESPGWIVIGIVLGSKRTVTAPEDET